MKKLITMTEYIIWLNYKVKQNQDYYEVFYTRVTEYVKLLQTPLELGQFIPCDENGYPIEKPEDYGDDCMESLNKILFKEWKEVINQVTNTELTQIANATHNITLKHLGKHKFLNEYKTIEDLINFGIELIPSQNLTKQL